MEHKIPAVRATPSHHRSVLTRGHGCVAILVLAALSAPTRAAVAASPIAFFNMADSEKTYPVGQTGPTPITSVTLDTSQPANVLMQFSSGVTVETSEGCPCSIRAFLQLDAEHLQPVKRINLGSPAVTDVARYEHDRQEITGSLVFPVDAGTHRFTLVMQQVTGSSKQITAVYPNVQAIAFPK